MNEGPLGQNGLTLFRTLVISRNLWQWMQITGGINKSEYTKSTPELTTLFGGNDCSCCKYALVPNVIYIQNCYVCPLTEYAWKMRYGSKVFCEKIGSQYWHWMYKYNTVSDRMYWAGKIVQSHNRAIEDVLLGIHPLMKG